MNCTHVTSHLRDEPLVQNEEGKLVLGALGDGALPGEMPSHLSSMDVLFGYISGNTVDPFNKEHQTGTISLTPCFLSINSWVINECIKNLFEIGLRL